MKKKHFRNLLIGLLTLLLLTTAFFIAVRYPSVQTWLAQRATDILSRSLGTKVSIERVEIQFFNKADLINFCAEDYRGDTLISANEFRVNFKIFELFRKRIEVSKIYLNEGTVHLYRDSAGEMNLNALLKHFQSESKKVDTTKSSFKWNIDLQEAELLNTDFQYLDDKAHSDIKVFVPTCEIDLNKLSLAQKIIDIASIKIDGTNVSVDLLKRAEKPKDDSLSRFAFMAGGMKVKFEDFSLTNTQFSMTDHNSDTVLAKGMDFKRLKISDINFLAENGSIEEDSILARIEKFSAKERSGFELKNLSAQAKIATDEISLNQLELKTANSQITNSLSLKFDNGFSDFKNFTNSVTLKADFKNTIFSLKDLSFFIKNLDKVAHNKFSINGKIEGRINSLRGKEIEIRAGSSTIFKGDFSAYGLPNVNETSLNLRLNRLATTVDDIKKFYPEAKLPPNLSNLGLIYYTGSLDGFLTDFVSNGKFVTSIGSAITDVNFKYDKKNNKALYDGDLALNEFDLGKFFNLEKTFGKVSLQTKISGGGLTLESLHAALDGNISSMSLLGYDYRNVQVNGLVLQKSFSGSLDVRDSSLVMNFNGKADLSQKIPEFNFNANIEKALLKNLNIAKDDIRISGKVKSNFRGGNVDDMQGKIEMNDVMVSRDSIEDTVRNFTLTAKLLSKEKKEISINSDFAEADMEGNFSLKELPKAILNFAKYTFTKDFADTAKIAEQNFTTDIRIYEPGNLPQIIYPKFKLIRNSHIEGNFNSANHQLEVKADIPEIQFDSYNARRIAVNSHFKNGKFDFLTSVDKVYSKDSLLLDTLNISSQTLENKDVRFDVAVADKKRFNYANITAFLTPQKGNSILRLDTSDIKLGNNFWRFNADNSIFIEDKKITSNHLIFKTQEQTVYISSYLKNDTSTSLKLTFDNTSLTDFTGIFSSKIKDLHGTINGNFVAEDLFYKPNVYANLVVNDLMLDKELIGDVNIDSRLDESGKNVLLYASVKSVNNFVEANGKISFADKTPAIEIDVDAPRLGLNFLNYKFFTQKYVKDCKGYAVVNATLAGPLTKPLLTGSVLLVDDTVTVSFLNTTYHVNNQQVILDEHGFNFPDLKIFDVRNNPLYASGRINHESFKNFALDLKVRTDNAQFLNTTEKQSPGFYGVAFGSGNIVFQGDVNSPTIKAYARTLAGTYCRLPINSSYEVNRYGFYKFVNPNAPKNSAQKNSPHLHLNGVHFIVELEATPDARMDIILDPAAGDVLTTYGSGDLKIEIPKTGSTTIYGNYEIERGNYLFTLQNVVNKKLEIVKGGTINFNGDAYKAALNMNASYEVRSTVSDLISDLLYQLPSGSNEQLLAAARSRATVKLLMNLTGVLERPNVAFDFQIVDPDPLIKSYVEQKLTLLKTNENEMNKQVFSLLVMNQFFPTANTSNAVSNYIGGTATNTVSEFLSSQLSNYLGNLLDYTGNNALQNLDLNIGYRQYDQSTTNNLNPSTSNNVDTRRELQLALQQRLLNNRLTINAGGNFDFGSGSSNLVDSLGGKSMIPTGDFQVQYALTPDGRWRAKAFNRTNYDYYNSRNNNVTGIGISYSQEFDKPSEFVKKKAKKVKKKK